MKITDKPTMVRTQDGRVLVRRDLLGQAFLPGQNLLAPDTVATVPGAKYYQPVSEPTPIEDEEMTYLPESVIEPVPRSVVAPERRTAYPGRSEKTRRWQKSMSPEEYLKKKTFERPGFLTLEDQIQTTNPWEGSMLVPGPSGTTATSVIKITSDYDFETVKIMTIGRKLVDQAWANTKNYLVDFKDLATGLPVNNRPVHAENFGGDSTLPLILPVTQFLNRASQIQIEFTNVEPVDTDIYVYFTLLGIRYFYTQALNLTTGIPEEAEYKRL